MTRFRKIKGRKWNRFSLADNRFASLAICHFEDGSKCLKIALEVEQPANIRQLAKVYAREEFAKARALRP